MLEPNSKINDLDVLVLNKCLEGWRDEALAWLRKSGWLEPAQDLEGLTWGQWSRIFNNLDGFKRKVTPGVAAKEDQQKGLLEDKRREEEQRRRRADQLFSIRPAEYEDLSADKAPRPVQFKLVSGFLTEDASVYFTAAAERVHGLVLYGKPRLGKTAACWQLVANYWNALPHATVEFIKTVRLVRKAKSRHLGMEAKLEFDKLFARLLNCDLLILDDLGSEKMPESAEEVLFELIDTRTEEWRFTVITSNSDLRTLAGSFERNREKMEGRLRQFFLPVAFDK